MFPEEIIMNQHGEEKIFEIQQEYPCVVRRINSRIGNELIAPWHWHKELELLFIRRGNIEYNFLGKKIIMKEGDGLFVNSNVLHQTNALSVQTGADYDVIMFQKEFIGMSQELIEKKFVRPLIYNSNIDGLFLSADNQQDEFLLILISAISEMESEKKAGYEIQIRNLLSEIWLELFKRQEETDTEKNPVSVYKNEARIKSMLLYIQENYMHDISLHKIASWANISERECLRCFKTKLNITPFQYLRSLRLQTACELLRYSEDTVTVIAMKTGFSSVSYFSKVFKEDKKDTPGAYRGKFRSGMNLPEK